MTQNSKANSNAHNETDNQILVLDTSLRDGEQAPGFNMNPAQKLKMAHQLNRLGVDIIEAGFAASSPGDFASLSRIASEVEGPVIASLSRAMEGDIISAARALESAQKKRLHIFLATSPLHREFKLKQSRKEVLKTAVEAVSLASSIFEDVQFSPEDATRTELDYLVDVDVVR